MKLVLFSDTHARHRHLSRLPKGDLAIFAGDCLGWGNMLELYGFVQWLEEQATKFKYVLMVAGNHDRIIEQQPEESRELLYRIPNLIYLQDSGEEVEGVRFWGSPWTIEFKNWHFMRRGGPDIDKAWALIPDDTQVLITHSPPANILDKGSIPNTTIGCEMLAYRLGPDGNLKPRLHVFGHSHESYGQEEANGILHVNAALCNGRNDLVRKPVVLELEFD